MKEAIKNIKQINIDFLSELFRIFFKKIKIKIKITNKPKMVPVGLNKDKYIPEIQIEADLINKVFLLYLFELKSKLIIK